MEQIDHLEPKPPIQYPFHTVLFLTILCIAVGTFVGLALQLIAYQAFGVDHQTFFSDLNTHANDVNARNFLRGVTMLEHLFVFAIPSIVAAWFLFQKTWKRQLQLMRMPQISTLALTLLLILFALPLVAWSIWLNQLIPLPDWATGMEDQLEGLLRMLLTMDSPFEVVFSFVVMAVVPAVGEELLFRGLLQNQLEKLIKNPHAAVWIAAFIFSFFHFQFEGFLARFVLGAILGYSLIWTRNLWIPIFGHLVFNGTQVLTTALYHEKLDDLDLQTAQQPELVLLIISAILVPMIGYVMQRIHNKTTLTNTP